MQIDNKTATAEEEDCFCRAERKEESSEEESAINEIISSNYLDGSYFVGEHGYLFLDVRELNTIMGTSNFDIEVFEIETETDKKTGANKEVLRSLQFLPESNARIGAGNEEVRWVHLIRLPMSVRVWGSSLGKFIHACSTR